MPALITVRTLGPPSLTMDGELAPPELTWRKHLALVVYLARSPRGRTREHLAGLLWADRPEGAARHSLNVALHAVRRHAGDASVEVAGGVIRLAAGTIRLDVDTLESAAARCDWHVAATLVAGEFMEGFAVPGASAFEDWLAAERTAWRQRGVDVLVHRCDELLRDGQAQDAVALGLRAAALDTRSEVAERAVVRSLALAGDPAAALDHFETFASRLEAEFGARPESDTQSLVARVREQRRARPPARAGASPGPESPPLAGRETELQGLLDALAGARGIPRASALVIEGESGTGKTRLLDEVLGRARLDGWTVTSARAVEADAAQPWSGALTLARGGLVGAGGLAGAPTAALGAFAAILPEWAERFPGAAGALTPWPLGRALSEVLRASTDEQPVMLAVDDAQWLDRESLLSLLAALRDLAAAPLVLALGVAPYPACDDLDELRRHLGREIGGAVVSLGPLGPAALTALARRYLPRYTEVELDRLVRRVAIDSAGLPLLAVELFRAVALGLDLGATQAAWPEPARTLDQSLPGDLPDAVVAAIRVAYRRLSVDAQRVLAAASIFGDRVAADHLVRALHLPETSVHEALDELEWHRWLASEPRGYGFVARIVRQIIERDMLTPGQRRRLLESDAGAGRA
ncbi:MAG: AAA family ATPase [Gemmatimonadales bacterium]